MKNNIYKLLTFHVMCLKKSQFNSCQPALQKVKWNTPRLLYFMPCLLPHNTKHTKLIISTATQTNHANQTNNPAYYLIVQIFGFSSYILLIFYVFVSFYPLPWISRPYLVCFPLKLSWIIFVYILIKHLFSAHCLSDSEYYAETESLVF